MANIHLIIALLLFINYPGSDGFDRIVFQQEALARHNYFRQLHCTPSMTLNSTITNTAQTYADYLASNGLFDHSNTPDLGESLYETSASVAITYVNGSEAVNYWYDEISSYDYNNPVFGYSTGHFTQVIWKNSLQLGIGIGFSTNSLRAVIVANYYPPGNYDGEFVANVPPVCSGGVGGD